MLGKAIRGTSFPIGSVPRWFTVFIEKYLVVFLGLGTDSKKHVRNKIRKTLFRTCRFWSVLIDQLTEKLFSKSGQIYFEIVRSLSVYGVVSGSLLCVQVDFDLAF